MFGCEIRGHSTRRTVDDDWPAALSEHMVNAKPQSELLSDITSGVVYDRQSIGIRILSEAHVRAVCFYGGHQSPQIFSEWFCGMIKLPVRHISQND